MFCRVQPARKCREASECVRTNTFVRDADVADGKHHFCERSALRGAADRNSSEENKRRTVSGVPWREGALDLWSWLSKLEEGARKKPVGFSPASPKLVHGVRPLACESAQNKHGVSDGAGHLDAQQPRHSQRHFWNCSAVEMEGDFRLCKLGRVGRAAREDLERSPQRSIARKNNNWHVEVHVAR